MEVNYAKISELKIEDLHTMLFKKHVKIKYFEDEKLQIIEGIVNTISPFTNPSDKVARFNLEIEGVAKKVIGVGCIESIEY